MAKVAKIVSIASTVTDKVIVRDNKSNSRLKRRENVNSASETPIHAGRLEKFFTIEDLQAIEKAFNEKNCGRTSYRRLNRDEFCNLMIRIFPKKWSRSEYAELFKNIDVRHEGYVDFGKFCSYMMHGFSKKHEKELRTSQIPQWKEPKIIANPHRDTIQKIELIFNPVRYVTVSKEGTLCCWSSNGKLIKQGKIEMEYISSKNLWITCYTIIQDLGKIAVAFTDKEIAIYNFDVSLAGDFALLCRITDLPAIPLTMNNWATNDSTFSTMLVFGDNTGMISSLKFSSNMLPSVEWRHWSEGKDDYVKNFRLPNLIKDKGTQLQHLTIQAHKEWVRDVRYVEKLESFLSCATTDTNSLVVVPVRHGTSLNKISFNIVQGVNTFDYDDELNVIATGGVNHLVHLWNPYVNSKPVGILRGHLASVVYVQFYSPKGQLISMGSNKVVRVWDAELHVCLQRISGLFTKGPEVHCNLYFDEENRRLVAAISKELVVVEMKAELTDHVTTHTKPVSCVLYSSKWKEIITAGKDSTITMWLLETGQRERQFPNAHGESEITCLALDSRQIQLFSGSTDGTVKVWDMNGHCHHNLIVACGNPADISQILTLKRQIFVVGWDKKPRVFQFSDITVNSTKVNPTKWSNNEEHQEEIVSVAFYPPYKIATATFDGEIIVWSLTTEKPTMKFKLRDKSASTAVSKEGDELQIQNQISQILYLVGRVNSINTCDLISCGGKGMISFWNTSSMLLYPTVSFMAHQDVNSVTMAVDNENKYLVSGDSDGVMKIWDIEHYYTETVEFQGQTPPTLLVTKQPHADGVTSIEICQYQEKLYILTASLDWTVALSNIDGIKIGIFGQSHNWKLATLVMNSDGSHLPQLQDSEKKEKAESTKDVKYGSQHSENAKAKVTNSKNASNNLNGLRYSQSSGVSDMIMLPPIPSNEISSKSRKSSREKSGDRSKRLPSIGSGRNRSALRSRGSSGGRASRLSTTSKYNDHYNTWDRTILGKSYQEHHRKKIKRRFIQPKNPPPKANASSSLSNDSGYLYHSLDCSAELDVLPPINLPDMKISRDHATRQQLYGLRSPDFKLRNRFDERTLFPKYLLEFENKLKHVHKGQINQVFTRRGKKLL